MKNVFGEREGGTAPLPIPPHMRVDLELARQTGVPVLVSGERESSLRVALDIAAGAGCRHAGDVMTIDLAQAIDLCSVMSRAGRSGSPRAVIFRDVQSFGWAEQAALVDFFGGCKGTTVPRTWRVISTASVTLFDRVLDGSFNARLFYILNRIHIVMRLPECVFLQAKD